MRAHLFALLFALAGCAAPAPTPAGHAGHDGSAQGTAAKRPGAMGGMEEMCKRHAAERGAAASEPAMMARHCRAKPEAAPAAR